MNDPPITLVYLYLDTNEFFTEPPTVVNIKAVLQNPHEFTLCGLLPVELRPQTERNTL